MPFPSDLDETKPVGSGAGAEGVDSADNYLRLIQTVMKAAWSAWMHPEDASPNPKIGMQDALASEIPTPLDGNFYINLSKGIIELRIPLAGHLYDSVATSTSATTTLGSPTVAGGTSTEKWLTNAQPGRVWVSAAGNPYTIKSIESETSMTLTTDIIAADVQTAGAYNIRLLYDTTRWFPILSLGDLVRGHGARVYRDAAQVIATATDTKVEFNAETYDLSTEFDSTTNYRFTPTSAGRYLVQTTIAFDDVIGHSKEWYVTIKKNGVVHARSLSYVRDETSKIPMTLPDIVDMDGSTDYIEVFIYHEHGSNRNLDGEATGARVYATFAKLSN